ncbi:MAG TPA: LCP family protein [Intrasporangium sp.]|uniref:LCP family protein n=1 Tax=Intrasporangium sp. TaxID=1925024 RepID=UPI002B47AC1B|nr:LCP family protein [Intrasporangium sp.]HKX65714.1 LCP family protein [Intrasporangium sp.]
MPTDSSQRRSGGDAPDDDVYVVDTRKRRPTPAQPGAGRPETAEEHDAYTVDTRDSGKRQRPASGPARPSSDEPAGPPRQTAPPPTGPGRRLRKGRLALLVAGLLVVAWLAFLILVPVWAWATIARVDNVPAGERPADTSGHNYLLVGSDSREGLTDEQRRDLKTGKAGGNRTDTIMLVHVSENGGKPVLISIPRDSYVPIPGHGSNKINAAFALGGPKLLTQTVEQVTGLHINGYLEIGLGGFAGMVDALGGVELCVPRDMQDDKAGIDLKKGCQVLDGKNALGYVRSRYEDPLGDIGRANRQRQFLGALMKQSATPSTVLLPWRYKTFVDAAAGGVAVGEETSLFDAFRIIMAMRAVSNEEGLSLTVPIADMAFPTDNAGVAVKWDTERALDLFRALRDDEPLTEPPPGTTPGQDEK